MTGVFSCITSATFIGTAHPEMEKCDRERDNASCKDHKEDPDFDHGLLDDCHVLADALTNPQLNQLMRRIVGGREKLIKIDAKKNTREISFSEGHAQKVRVFMPYHVQKYEQN